MSNKLLEIKQQLFELLGEENEKIYLQYLKQWLLGKCTCEQFHSLASELTVGEQVTLHNKLIVEILTNGFSGRSTVQFRNNPEKIESFHKSSTSSRRKRGSSKVDSYKAHIDLTDSNEFILPNFPYSESLNLQNLRFAADELFLPDVEMINGRFLITAWTEKLTGVDKHIAEIVIQALQIYLKNILTAIITKFRGFKVRGRFQYDIGCEVPNPWLRNSLLVDMDRNDTNLSPVVYGNCILPSLKPTLPKMEMKTLFAYSCSGNPHNIISKFNGKIMLEHMYHALKHNSKVIGNHCIYSTHMEKLTLALRQSDCNST